MLLSAVLLPEFMYDPIVLQSGSVGTFGHGFTYSGHPVCTAVALRTIELAPKWKPSVGSRRPPCQDGLGRRTARDERRLLLRR